MSVKFKRSEFAESVRELYLREFPNPDRIGCPEPERLRKFAWRKDLEHSEEIALHLIHCSPCYQQKEQYLEDYWNHVRRKKIKTTLQVGAAVTALLALAAPWAWRNLRPRDRAQPRGVSVSDKQVNPSGGYQEAYLRLNDPSLGQDEANAGTHADALELARGQLMVSIELPPDTRMEPFEVKISVSEDKPLIQERGQVVRDEKGKIQLKVAVNTTQLRPGQYFLGLRQANLDWVTLPLWIR
jgi:hypothetical protein